MTPEELAGRTVTSVAEAAECLAISKAHAYSLARSGELPGIRQLGGRYVVVAAELRRFLGLEPEIEPTPEGGLRAVQ